MLRPPASPKIRVVSSQQSSSSRRVLFEEMLSAQADLEGVPEDEFFLVGPKQVFDFIDPVEPLLVRPRSHRSSEDLCEPSSVTTSLPGFQPILEHEADEDRVYVNEDENLLIGEAQLGPLRLQPRLAPLQDGHHSWTSIVYLL